MPKTTWTHDEVSQLVKERMEPINARMAQIADENQRLREGQALESYVDARVVAAEEAAAEKVKEAERKAQRYARRAYEAERKLKGVLDGSIDPFDLMGDTAKAEMSQT